MENHIQNLILGGHYKLSAEGYWMDAAKLVWVNKGKRIDDSEPVTIFLFNPKLAPADVENSLQKLKGATQNLKKIDSGAQKLESGVVTYVVFKSNSGNKYPEKEIPHTINIPKVKVRSNPQRNLIIRSFSALLVVFLFLGCLLVAYAGLPVIQGFFQPPTTTATITPTAVSTPTPQVFTFKADTIVTNFITGESFIIPKDAKVIIENPTHTACEVLANWKGTQIIISAKMIFPDRNCP